MFKFYNILRNRGGRNNSGSITVRHRGYSYIRRRAINFFNFRKLNFSNFKKHSSNFFSTSFVNFSFSKFNFIFSKNSTYPSRLFEFKPGSYVCNIEAYPGSGPTYTRSVYSRAIVIRRLGTNSIVKLSSGEIRKFKAVCYAFPALNESFVKFKKSLKTAGAARRIGIRPHVRGCAINPVDHPHGGRTGESRPSVSPWAKLTKGFRTRYKVKDKKTVIVSVQELKNKQRNKKKK